MSVPTPFPFAAVVGAEDAKLALLLAAVDPAIGGVLLRGDKGSAKTTLARGLAALDGRPFAELPLSATEERVVGSLDVGAALAGAGAVVRLGVLADAHGGVLYVDEVNLLADHLVDVLLDVAASGTNRIERDGVAHAHPARFVLVGSMNPEEGDLRPQLLDRFGLAVDVRAVGDPEVRAEAVGRRLAHDADPAASTARWRDATDELRGRLARTVPAPITPELLLGASRVCVGAGAEGLRADLVLARAAAALAGWDGRTSVTEGDLARVAPLVLAHRARRDPLDPPGAPPPDLDDLVARALGPDGGPGDDRTADDGTADDRTADDGGAGGPSGVGGRAAPSAGDGGAPDVAPSAAPTPVIPLVAPRAEHPAQSGRRSPAPAPRGRSTGHRPLGGSGGGGLAPMATLSTAVARWAAEPGAARRVVPEDLREHVREGKAANLVVLAVDASGSMGAERRMAAVKGALLGLLGDAYRRRDRVALVTFGGGGARIALRPTGSVEVARRRLDELPTGGDTPLAAGILAAADLARRSGTAWLRPLLVVVTDGRATAGDRPVDDALAAAAEVAHHGVAAVVVDVESPGPGHLGLAADLAAAMGARHLPLAELRAEHLQAAVHHVLADPGARP